MQERAAAVGAVLDIISEEGRGATVRLSVPVRQAAMAQL
jgi:signal transduction histidine kinase